MTRTRCSSGRVAVADTVVVLDQGGPAVPPGPAPIWQGGAVGSDGATKVALNRAAVAGAACGIAEEHGLEAVTMRRVAEALGAGPMSLYRHVADRDDLLVAMLEQVAGGLPRRPPPQPGPPSAHEARARVVQGWSALHTYFTQHRWVVQVLADGTLVATAALPMIEGLLRDLVACGLEDDAAARTYLLLWHAVIGEVLEEVPADEVLTQRRAVTWGADPAELPTLARLMPVFRELRGEQSASRAGRMAWAVGVVVDGALADRAGRFGSP